ncbi:MAG TPA: hypothetical protein VF548_09795 [Allosphingosinicella sp.]|jgi:hypothetical protein
MARYVKIGRNWNNPDQVTMLYERRQDDGSIATRIHLADNNMVGFPGTEQEALRHLQR